MKSVTEDSEQVICARVYLSTAKTEDGFDYKPVSEIRENFAIVTDEKVIRQVKRAMVKAGILDKVR